MFYSSKVQPHNMISLNIASSFCSPDERGRLVREVKGQLKKIAITDKSNIRAMFLKYDKDRSGYLNKWKVKEMCKSLHLPQDDDILDEVSGKTI